MPRKPLSKPKPLTHYWLEISGWAVGYSVSNRAELAQEHLGLEVDLLPIEPIKGVARGSLSITGTDGRAGGIIHYNSEKFLQGFVAIGTLGTSALIALLVAGRRVVLVLTGEPFRYRKSYVAAVSWYTEGHSELADPD